ncbi:MerR family DNA-binding transcriptional regulator [Celeribacter arenosi]|uniref:MerR family DNA-binding transcriptional regulator n=1 Tax=Celeribacter arenosi TaxID=792649 RepID=A0ABP7K3W9_9RHOB
MTTETMTIREMCEAFDVTPRTLRFYEAKELLFPKREGQKRLFTRRDRARLTLIQRGKRFGFPLEEIRQILDLYELESERAQLIETRSAFKRRRIELDEQIRALEAVRSELDEQIEWVNTQIDGREESVNVA